MPAVMRGIVNRIRMREARTKHEEGAEEQRQERRCSDACARIDRICSRFAESCAFWIIFISPVSTIYACDHGA